MGVFLKPADFTGIYAIGQSSFSELQAYIDKYESKYLVELLGVELYKLFDADLDKSNIPAVAQTQLFIDIFDPILEDDSSGIRKSEGILEMLKGFIYFEYACSTNSQLTEVGFVSNNTETSRSVRFEESNIYRNYNAAFASYETIQWFICQDTVTYPKYNGQCKGVISWH